MRRNLAIAILALAVFSVHAQTSLGEAVANVTRDALAGRWVGEIGGTSVVLRLNENGSFVLDGDRGVWRTEAGVLILEADAVLEYSVTFTGRDAITLAGADLPTGLRLNRSMDTGSAIASSFRFNASSVVDRATSMAIVLVIVVVSRLIVGLLKMLSRVLINSERGLLKHVYQTEKRRTRTVHSLALDILKYVIYFTALGFILAELGVNYTAYLASLSVIGLAIGFGSQGLVQDIVTGFFLVFEDQISVGDMVEISGQIGRVRDMGLRMTKLENYAGQVVFIPNRNIAVVGRYIKGALSGQVSIDASTGTGVDTLVGIGRSSITQTVERFRGLFLEPEPSVDVLSSDNAPPRMVFSFAIWPGQQWVIESQLVRLVKNALESAEISYDAASIVVWYRDREETAVRSETSGRSRT